MTPPAKLLALIAVVGLSAGCTHGVPTYAQPDYVQQIVRACYALNGKTWTTYHERQ